MRLIDADALQTLFNEVSTSLLSKPELHKDAEHMVRTSLMTTEMIQDAEPIDAVPVSALRILRDDLCKNDFITLDGLRQMNTLIAMYEGGGADG